MVIINGIFTTKELSKDLVNIIEESTFNKTGLIPTKVNDTILLDHLPKDLVVNIIDVYPEISIHNMIFVQSNVGIPKDNFQHRVRLHCRKLRIRLLSTKTKS